MNDTDAVAFDAFLERNWGIITEKPPVYDENGNEIKNEPVPEKQDKPAPEVRKVPRTSSSVKATAQTVKKTTQTVNKATTTAATTAKPKQNPQTNQEKPTV